MVKNKPNNCQIMNPKTIVRIQLGSHQIVLLLPSSKNDLAVARSSSHFHHEKMAWWLLDPPFATIMIKWFGDCHVFLSLPSWKNDLVGARSSSCYHHKKNDLVAIRSSSHYHHEKTIYRPLGHLYHVNLEKWPGSHDIILFMTIVKIKTWWPPDHPFRDNNENKDLVVVKF